MKQFITFHIAPFGIAIISSFILLYSCRFFIKNTGAPSDEILIADNPERTNYKYFENYCTDTENKIMHLAKSCRNKTIVLFGSSELTYDKKTPYFFFSDSHLKITGIGEGFNQTFSIYCQLLAMDEYAKNSNICILLSPGWFGDANGTNIKAFLEFVPELMQKRIWQGKTDEEFRNYVYSYMFKHKMKINTLPLSYSLLANLSPDNILPGTNKIFAAAFLPEKIDLTFSSQESHAPCKDPFILSWDSLIRNDQADFLTTCDSNSIYVYNEYYFKYLLERNGDLKFSSAPKVPFPNTELEDLKMLLKLLKYYNCNASFIMEALNPHYYHSLENYSPIMDSIHSLIVDKYHYPYYNMFVTDTAQYHPGDLMDVMHLGKAGWDKVNRFIYETYCNQPVKP